MYVNAGAVKQALREVYGLGSMVDALADHLVEKLPEFQAESEDPNWGRPVKDQVRLVIWNWFPGGDTAEIAAKKVMKALGVDL